MTWEKGGIERSGEKVWGNDFRYSVTTLLSLPFFLSFVFLFFRSIFVSLFLSFFLSLSLSLSVSLSL